MKKKIFKVWERLKAYEDTGLTPEEVAALRMWSETICETLDPCKMGTVSLERLRALAEADKDERVAVLPFRAGDTVWTNFSVTGDRYRLSDRPYPVKVVFFGAGIEKKFFHVEYSNGRIFPFDESAIGKTVFLTREDAEAELKKMEGKNDEMDG